jgi:hypothetical protein
VQTNVEKGREWEKLVCKIVNGKRMPSWFQYDIESASGKHLEVKGSSLRQYGSDSLLPKWHWNSLVGGSHQPKIYDRLILVGDGDESPTPQTHIYFDVPYWWVLNYVLYHKHGTIACPQYPKYLTNKPGIGVELHEEFKVDAKQLYERYGRASA